MRQFMASLALFSSVLFTVIGVMEAQSFDTNFVELDTSKMISTGDSNYAISTNNLPSNWRSVSVNGIDVTIATRDNQMIMKKYAMLTNEERNNLESTKSSLNQVIRLGPFNAKSQTGFAKLTTFDKKGGTSSMGTGGSSSSASGAASSSSSSSSSSSGGSSISKTGKDSFIVSKTDFPFNWQRVFVNEDITTVVYRDGRVIMLPQDLMRPDEKAKIISLKQEVDKSTKSTEKITSQIATSLKSPMDFVNKALGGLFG